MHRLVPFVRYLTLSFSTFLCFRFRECNVTSFPALVLFRNGHPVCYPHPLEEPGAARISVWMSDSSTLEIPGQIERVNQAMLRNVIEGEDAVLVFFCGEEDKNLVKIFFKLKPCVLYVCNGHFWFRRTLW